MKEGDTMFKQDFDAVAAGAQGKLAFLRRSLLGYFAASMLAGIYVAFGGFVSVTVSGLLSQYAGIAKLLSAFSALLPHFRDSELTVSFLTEFLYEGYFRLRIGHKRIECDNNRHTVFMQILNMFLQIYYTCLQCCYIFLRQVGFSNTAIIF